MKKLLFLDCDSTLCAIEGVDELAALRGPQVEQQVVALTNQAMDGTIPIDEIFGRRLDLIRPTHAMCTAVAQDYISALSPGVREALATLRDAQWQPIIISGGFTQVIEPVARELDIEEIYAVSLTFRDNGDYLGFDTEAPTARNGGKPDIIREIRGKIGPCQVVMVGDGISDWETSSVVDLFVGFGGVVSREKVKAKAEQFITHFSELPTIIAKHPFPTRS